jgi:hypothetical protein
MQSDIRRFLQDGHYAQGVELLRRCPGVAPVRLRYFESHLARHYVPTGVERELEELLRAFLEDGTRQTGSGANEGPEPGGEAGVMDGQAGPTGAVSGSFWGKVFGDRETVPTDIWKLYGRAVALHKQQANAHPLMVQAATDGKRKEARELAAMIMDGIIPELDGIYGTVREWAKSGMLPTAAKVDGVVRQTVERMRRIEYCKQRISRIRAWLKAGERTMTVDGRKQAVALDFSDRRELEKELLEREVEMKGIREELGIDD